MGASDGAMAGANGDGASCDVSIRAERPEDAGFVFALNVVAFGGLAEARLVDRLRREITPFVSLVATQPVASSSGVRAERVVGHIAFSPVRVASADGDWTAMGLAPLAVAPARQRSGIGSLLVKAGFAACRALGENVVFVLGHRTYYPRFGFVRADERGCTYEGGDAFAGSFFVAELAPAALRGRCGVVHYAAPFAAL